MTSTSSQPAFTSLENEFSSPDSIFESSDTVLGNIQEYLSAGGEPKVSIHYVIQNYFLYSLVTTCYFLNYCNSYHEITCKRFW